MNEAVQPAANILSEPILEQFQTPIVFSCTPTPLNVLCQCQPKRRQFAFVTNVKSAVKRRHNCMLVRLHVTVRLLFQCN